MILLGTLADNHVYLCRRIANQYKTRTLADVDDMAQEGLFGLLRAESLYDSTQGSFVAYARLWIRHSIRRHLQDCWNRVRLPNHCYVKFARYIREEVRLQQENEVKPLFSEVVESFNLSPTERTTMWRIIHTVRSLNVLPQQLSEERKIADHAPSVERAMLCHNFRVTEDHTESDHA